MLSRSATDPSLLKDLRVCVPQLPESQPSSCNIRAGETYMSVDKATEYGRLWRKRPLVQCSAEMNSNSDSDTQPTGETLAGPAKGAGHKSKRGKGRSRTSSLTQVRRKYVAAKEKNLHLTSEEEVLETSRTVAQMWEAHRSLAKPQSGVDVSKETMESLKGIVDGYLDVITSAARKSKNLKGTMIKSLKVATERIKEAVGELMVRSIPEEVTLLKAANATLEKQIGDLRKEIDDLRRQPVAKAQNTDEIVQKALVAVGNMINARFAGIEDRLLPQPRLRPAIAADRRQTAKTPTASGASLQSEDLEVFPALPPSSFPNTTESGNLNAKNGKKNKTKKMTMAAKEAMATAAARTMISTQPISSNGKSDVAKPTEWSRVVAGGKTNTIVEANKKKKEPKPRLRPPKTAAITLTLKPDAITAGMTYESVLCEAKGKIDLPSLGIESVRFRKAATGARLLEVSGEGIHSKADTLAEKLKAVLSPDMVKVQRPMMRTDFRVSGLDDSVKPEEVAEAIAKLAACEVGYVRAGRIGPAGATIVSCPTTSAKKVVDAGRVVIGWTSARVVPIMRKQQRCYRCLGVGHVGAICISETDRSRQCLRCGQEGHAVRDCKQDPHCVLCAEAKKPAAHQTGEQGCTSCKSKGGRNNKTASGQLKERQGQSMLTSFAVPLDVAEPMDATQ
ncbi:unnamed protein product [Danaus chrysippus]|uniref:(African queen) hypothetical protein n=1 Tax=Danaus chrysippus TaxID=151541 RepID=A0A8J2VTP0_9NEOP|nr:unnamed protein product [Danaus chrysippus]